MTVHSGSWKQVNFNSTTEMEIVTSHFVRISLKKVQANVGRLRCLSVKKVPSKAKKAGQAHKIHSYLPNLTKHFPPVML